MWWWVIGLLWNGSVMGVRYCIGGGNELVGEAR